MYTDQDLNFLHLFITEPIYLPDEPTAEDSIADPQNTSDVDANMVSQKAPDEAAFTGQNKKNILILVDEEGAEFMKKEHQQLLHNILSAVHLTIDDIKLVNIRKSNTSSASLINALEKIPFTILISFGAIIPEWPICHLFSQYVVNTDSMSRKILLADHLNHLAEDPHKKKSLWICLQHLFN